MKSVCKVTILSSLSLLAECPEHPVNMIGVETIIMDSMNGEKYEIDFMIF